MEQHLNVNMYAALWAKSHMFSIIIEQCVLSTFLIFAAKM